MMELKIGRIELLGKRISGLSLALSLAAVLPLATCHAVASQEEKPDSKKDNEVSSSEPTLESMRKHRIELREALMLPSLKGIRGLSYGLPGHFPSQGLEKAIENSLGHLSIPISRITELQDGVTKPVDAILQVKVLKAGANHSLVELTVTQWCSLMRDPESKIRTITYTDQTVTGDRFIRDTVVRMVDQFVIDYMKANKVDSASLEKSKASSSQSMQTTASDSKSGKEKKSKKKKSG